MNARILIVEDDEVIAAIIEKQTEQWGFEPKRVRDFSAVMKEFADFAPQLVLLDISLPFFNGYHWCAQIRRVSRVPVMFISSAADNMNIVMAMNMGADDFIAKPFDLDVLVAKIQALLRRTYDFGADSDLAEHNGLVLNASDQTAMFDGKTAELTKNEKRILQTLMKGAGKIVTRDELMEKLWSTDSFVDENTLSVNVTRLRKKLEELGLTDYIITKKGVGYTVK